MRLAFAYLVSTLVHLGVIGGMAYWLPRRVEWQVEYTLVQGEPITAVFSPPSAAQEQQVEVEIAEETVEQPPPAPPVELEAEVVRPTEQPPLEIDVVPTTKPFDRPIETSLSATEPVAAPPPTDHPPELEPAKPAKSEARPETPQKPVVEPTRALARKLRPTPDLTSQQSVAMPFQRAVQTGVQVDQLPRKSPSNVPPHYPADALLAGLEGRVMLRVVVADTGLVEGATVHTTSGVASLDAAAVQAVLRWRFDPARRAGQAVTYEVLVPVRFSILGN